MWEKKTTRSRFTLGSGDKEIGALSKTITITYILALALIAALSLSGYLALRSVIKTQEKGLKITKEISSQRLLSQRISLLALRFVVESDPKKRSELRESLVKNVAEMKVGHEKLTAQRAEWKLLTKYSDEGKEAYLNPPIELDRRVDAFLTSAHRLSLTPNKEISLRNPDVVFLVSTGSDSLLESFNYSVSRYETVTNNRISFLKAMELAFLLSTLMVLAIEAWFIFRPMVRKIQESTRDLNNSAKETAAIIETVGEGILSCDEHGAILGLNKEAARLWKTSKENLTGISIFDLFVINDAKAKRSDMGLPHGRWVERTAKSLDGKEFLVEAHRNRVEVDGIPIEVIAIRDIKKRKEDEARIRQSLEEKKILLQEIHHRVKNNLQIISSFLSLQSRNLQDKEVISLFQESRNRVDTMSLIHEELYKSKDLSTINFGTYIGDLVANLFRTYGINSSKISFKLKAEGALFNIDTAVPCGLIINELVSNSLEHAFRQSQGGEISIELLSDGDHSWKLLISDNGIGMDPTIDICNSKSMGLRLVNALVAQLRGTMSVSTDVGTKYTIHFLEDVKTEKILNHG